MYFHYSQVTELPSAVGLMNQTSKERSKNFCGFAKIDQNSWPNKYTVPNIARGHNTLLLV